ncbi:MAG: hypothetical protein J6K98_03975 [Clostridia bacterium]|nr:hypothetical protein [Clostridia bacterium]
MLHSLLIASPNTGVDLPIAPFIFGGLALVLIVAMVALTLMGKKKPTDPSKPSSTDPSDEA